MLKIRSTSEEPRYTPYAITHKMRKLSTPVRINGKEVIRYPAPVITEYVDMETGELIEAAALKKNPEVWPTVYCSERVLQREFIIASLRKEVREFALFVLAFRNQRRGVTPGVDHLVEWYAELNAKQVCHIRRYVQRLNDAGVIAGSSILGPLFQIAGNNIPAITHLSEDFNASAKFMLMLIKKKAKIVLRKAAQPYLAEEPPAAATRAVSTCESKVHKYIQALISAGKLRPQFPCISA